MKIRLAAYLQSDSIVDGEGIRTVIWTQGCPHHCLGCHNPETWPLNSGIPFFIGNITDTVIHTSDGKPYIVNGGYLDIGIIDTMKDLLVNLVGAVVFSIIGYSTLKFSKKSAIAENLMIKPVK